MNAGIGDAYNLGWKLALVAGGRARAALLDSYEAERMPFARAILDGSDRGFIAAVTTNPVGRRLKLVAVPCLFRVVSRVPPLRRRAFWLLSQLWTRYRDSPAVAAGGSADGGPRAGDRAPSGTFEAGPEAGADLFAALTGTGQHLLLFEGRRPDRARLAATLEELAALLGRYAARAPTLVLVRPDGDIAYRGGAADIVGLRLYLDRYFAGLPPEAEAVGTAP